MSQVSWEAFENDIDAKHREVAEKLYGFMESGYRDEARKLLEDYAVQYESKAEALRLSLVRKYGTGL